MTHKLARDGYYPAGGGIINVEINPCKKGLRAIKLLKRTPITQGFIKFIMTKNHISIKEEIKEICILNIYKRKLCT